MTVYGRYEALQEIGRRGPYRVFAARVAGSGGGGGSGGGEATHALVPFRDEAGLLDEEDFARKAAKFLECAALQEKVALAANPAGGGGGSDGGDGARASNGWARISERGRVADAAYFVTDLYPGSLAQSIDRKRRLEPVAIARIMTRMVEALEVLQAVARRPHGALSPDMVLLGAGAPGEEVVALTDPAHPSDLDARSEVADINAVGAMIFGLVVHRPAPKGGTIAVTPEFRVDRAQGEALRALCERLINARAVADAPLAEIKAALAKVATLKGKKKGTPPAVIFGGGGLVVAVLAVGVWGAMTNFWGLTAPPPPPPPPPEIELLADPRGSSASSWLVTEVVGIRQGIEAGRREAENRGCDEAEQLFVNLTTPVDEATGPLEDLRKIAWPDATMEPDREKLRALQDAAAARIAAAASRVGELQSRLAQAQADAATKCQVQAGEDPFKQEWLANRVQEMDTLLADITPKLEAEGDKGTTALADLRAKLDEAKRLIQAVRDHPVATDAEIQAAQALVPGTREARGVFNEAANAAIPASRARLVEYVTTNRERALSLAGDSARLRQAFEGVLAEVDPSREGVWWPEARRALEGLEPWLNAVNAALPERVAIEPGPEGEAASEVVTTAFDAPFTTQRTQCVEILADSLVRDKTVPSVTDPSFTSQLATQKQRLDAWAAGARDLVSTARQIEERLRLALGSAEVPEGAGGGGGGGGGSSDTIATLAGRVRAAVEPGAQYEAARAAVAPVLARVDALARVEAATDAEALLQMVPSAPGARIAPLDRAAARAAWASLARSQWPATADDLDSVRVRAGLVREAMGQIPVRARAQAVAQSIDEAARGMWAAFAGARAGSTPASVEKAYATREAFGITPAMIDALPGAARFNFALIEARAAIGAYTQTLGTGEATKEQMAELARLSEDFTARAKAAGVGREGEAWAAAAADLVRFLDQRALRLKTGKTGAAWTELGPGAANPSWSLVAADEDNGTFVEYQWAAPSGRTHRVRFNLLPAGSAASGVTYVATTEVSIGLFADVFAAAGGDLPRVLDSRDLVKESRGPLGWRTPREGARRFFPGTPSTGGSAEETVNGWFLSEQEALGPGQGLIPEGLTVAPPSWLTPMTHVSPATALGAARQLNCRVPSEGEWRAAQARGAGAPNLRDASWKSVYDLFRARVDQTPALGNKLGWPAGFIARPSGPAVEPGQDGTPAVTDNDGFPFFREVGTAEADFRDLIGNVAEWVIADGQVGTIEALAREALGASGSRRAIGDATRVIGGSALSPAEPPPSTPIAITNQSASAFGQGFSDVGFRLAFSSSEPGGGAGSNPGASLLARLTAQPFLAP
jgi:hypothetical protein